MVRSLWTAATGMIAQQTNLDTIANNLANVNTQGYKTQVNEFKTLFRQKQPPPTENRSRLALRWDLVREIPQSVQSLNREA